MKIQIELRTQVIRQLNFQYKTNHFKTPMTAQQIVSCAQESMKHNIDFLDYDLNTAVVHQYSICLKYCKESPFTEQEQHILGKFIKVIEQLAGLDNTVHNTGAIIKKCIQSLNDHIVKYGVKVRLAHRYHLFQLFFRKISIKQAIIFEVLSKCQVFYTIQRERKKSGNGKQFNLDPLIKCYQTIKEKLGIAHSFHETVLPRKQLRYFQKKNTDKKLKNTLFEAVSNRKYKEVKEMIVNGANIEQPGIYERDQTKRQMYCSHRACQLGDIQLCKILHSFKVNWDARQKQGYTPLHYAAQSGSLALVRYLIEQIKVELEPVDIQERTPFYFVCTEGDLDIIRYLYEKGANINSKSKLGRSALLKACFLGLVDVVNFLISCPGIILTSFDTKGRTALHNSVFGSKGGRQGHKFGTNQSDSPLCTQILLQNGFDVDVQDFEQNTPMHVSTSSDGIDSIRVLLAFGASLTKLNFYEETPLMTGAKFGHLQSVIMLRQQYGDNLLVKDAFGKNLMLLCAKFRQQDGKFINRVFYYATDQLLKMAANNENLQQGKNKITNWQYEIHYTFQQLLKQQQRVYPQFKYFVQKCIQYGIIVKRLSIDNIKSLILLLKNNENEKDGHISSYFIKGIPHGQTLEISYQCYRQFLKWLILENNTKMLDFIAEHETILKRYLKIVEKEQYNIMEQLASLSFQIIPEIKQKVLTYCLLKLNINWVDYIDDKEYYNILHLLVRYKKLGTLIQILKILSGIRLDFVTNIYLLGLFKEQQYFKQKNMQGQSPLCILLTNMLFHKNRQGFDPYNLAVLMKDASASKLLQEKLNSQTILKKSQFEVKQYTILLLEDEKLQIQKFNAGYEIQEELSMFMNTIQECKEKEELGKHCVLLRQVQGKPKIIDNFSAVWNNLADRKLNFLCNYEQLQTLNQIAKFNVIGIDIEYFYSQGATLISIMQLSTIQADYIIDFLHSAKDYQASQKFINKVSQILKPIAYNKQITKIMHGSDNDLCVIKSILKFSFLNFIDTAKLDIEIRQKQNIRGLATLVNQYLNEFMSKDYQVSEWRIRPIPSSMLEYARRDSLVLPFLARKMFTFIDYQHIKQAIFTGLKQAKRNKKSSQPLIRAMKQI